MSMLVPMMARAAVKNPEQIPVVGAGKRFGQNLVDSAKTRASNVVAYGEDVYNPNLSMVERVLAVPSAGVQAAAIVPDVIGAGVTFAGDAAIPGTPVADLVGAALQTETGRGLLSQYEALDEKTKRDISTALAPLEFGAGVFTGGRTLNSVLRNSETNVRDFYQPNVEKALMGLGEHFLDGAGQATKEMFTAGGQAMLRQGIPPGQVEELLKMIPAITVGQRAIKKKKDGESLSAAEQEAVDYLEKVSGGAMVKDTTALSYVEGSLIQKLYMMEQAGVPSELLQDLSDYAFAPYRGTLADTKGWSGALFGEKDSLLKETMGYSEKQIEELSKRMYNAMMANSSPSPRQYIRNPMLAGEATARTLTSPTRSGTDPNRMDVMVREPATQVNMQTEFSRTPVGKALASVDPDNVTPEAIEAAFEGVRDITKISDEMWIVNSGTHSRAKELGGIGHVTVINPKTGTAMTVARDRHDLFGVDPVDGKGLWTLSRPMITDMNKPTSKVSTYFAEDNVLESQAKVPRKVADRYNERLLTGEEMTPQMERIQGTMGQQRRAAEGLMRAEERTGYKADPNLRDTYNTALNLETGNAGLVNDNLAYLLDYANYLKQNPNPTMMDRARAAGNTVLYPTLLGGTMFDEAYRQSQRD
jgi:hypothetical protein